MEVNYGIDWQNKTAKIYYDSYIKLYYDKLHPFWNSMKKIISEYDIFKNSLKL